jgi:hypothetical protein
VRSEHKSTQDLSLPWKVKLRNEPASVFGSWYNAQIS